MSSATGTPSTTSFAVWEKRELWKRPWERFQDVDDEQLKELFTDSTIVRARQRAAGAWKERFGGFRHSEPVELQ